MVECLKSCRGVIVLSWSHHGFYAQIWRSASAHLCVSSTKSCRYKVCYRMDLACCDLLKTVEHPSFSRSIG